MLIEVPEVESAAKADSLAAKITEIFPEDEGIRVTRPTKRPEYRISGLEGSIQTEEVTAAVTAAGDSSENNSGSEKYRSALREDWALCGSSAQPQRPK